MQKFVCELCGGSDLIKQDGFFVCQSCGCKYSLEEAKKMMVADDTDEINKPETEDNADSANNYLELAENANVARNYSEAEIYANKVLESEPHNSEAWLIKGEAAGWQSTVLNSRIQETVNSWVNAVKYAEKEKKGEIRETIANKYADIFGSLVNLHTGYFSQKPNFNDLISIINVTKSGIKMMNTLVTKAGVNSFNRGEIYSKIANLMNNAAVDGWETVKNNFGPGYENMQKAQWDEFTQNGQYCAYLMEEALCYSRDIANTNKILDNIIIILTEIRDSCSWVKNTHSSSRYYFPYIRDYEFNAETKKLRSEEISFIEKQKSLCNGKGMNDFIDQISGSKKKQEEAFAIEKYWAKHPEERKKLESEKKTLCAEKESLNREKETAQISMKVQETQKQIDSLLQRIIHLGTFRGREKKKLQDQTDNLIQNLAELKQEAENEKLKFQMQINTKEKRIHEIDDELNKNRGYITTNPRGYSFSEIFANGKFNITPTSFIEYYKKLLPGQYKCTGIVKERSSFPEFGTQWKINTVKSNAPSDNMGIRVFCTAKNEDSCIDNIIIEGSMATPRLIIRKEYTDFIDLDGIIKNAKDFVAVGTCVLMALFPNVAQSVAELQIIDLLYGRREKSFTSHKGIHLEYTEAETTEVNPLSLENNIIYRETTDYNDGIIICAER